MTRRKTKHLATPRQTGGKWLAEGADGCVFTAPHNWPCASPSDLPAYSPEDPTLVTKIVAQADIEDAILKRIATIRSTYKLSNLPEYIGTCRPKSSTFKNNNMVSFTEHVRNLQKTRKGCAGWLENLRAGRPRKMYVLRQYIMTLFAYMQELQKKTTSAALTARIANAFAIAAPAFIHTLSVLATGMPYRVIHYDMHTKNIVLYEKPKSSQAQRYAFDPLDATTFTVGPADFGRALWRDMRAPITEQVAAHWDEPFLRQFILRKSRAIYWDFSQFSLENRIAAFIAQTPAKPTGKLWLQAWAGDSFVTKAIETSRDPLFFSLPTFLSVLSKSRKWQAFEANLEQLVRQLQAAGSAGARFALLHRNRKLRAFFDALKSRSMLPVALGLYLRNALVAMGISQPDLALAFHSRNELSYKKIHPALHSAFNQYWNMLYAPYSD